MHTYLAIASHGLDQYSGYSISSIPFTAPEAGPVESSALMAFCFLDNARLPLATCGMGNKNEYGQPKEKMYLAVELPSADQAVILDGTAANSPISL